LASAGFCVKWGAVGLLGALIASGCAEKRRAEPPKTAAEMEAARQGREILAAMAQRYRNFDKYACRIAVRTEDINSGRSSFVETGSARVEFRRGDVLRVWGDYPSLAMPGHDFDMICDHQGCRWRVSVLNGGKWETLGSLIESISTLRVISRGHLLLCTLLCDLRWGTRPKDYLLGTVEEAMASTVSLVRWEGEPENKICVLKAMCQKLEVEIHVRYKDLVLVLVKETLPASAGKGSRLVLRPAPDSAYVGTYEFHDIVYR